MRALFLLLALAVGGCSGCASLSEKRSHSSALRLDFPAGKCSATAIGPHKILSAAHCFAVGVGEMQVNGVPTGYVVTADDGKDHVLVTVTTRLTHWVAVGPAPKRGQAVFLQGNPGQFQDLLRRGYVAGTYDKFTIYDLNAYFGDSGAGIFDSSGRLIAVVCALAIESQQGATFQLMASQPFAFTAKEWAS